MAVVDLDAGSFVRTFPVDPGPRSLALNAARNQLLVLSQSTGTLDLVDLGTYTVSDRINATNGTTNGGWNLQVITSITPNDAKIGSSFT